MLDAYYDGIASGYNQLYGEEQNSKLNALAKLVQKHNIALQGELLDIGCGTGISTLFFQKKYGVESIGIDPSGKLLEQVPQDISAKKAQAEELPFPENTFAVIVSISAIQNFTDIPKSFSEIKRVAKPEAYLLLTFMSKNNPHKNQIEDQIRKTFAVIDSAIAKNDTIFICKV